MKKNKSFEQRVLEKDLHSDKYRCRITPYKRKQRRNQMLESWFDGEKEVMVDFDSIDEESITIRAEGGYPLKINISEIDNVVE